MLPYTVLQYRRQDFGSGETSNKISYMNSSQVLYCNYIAKISVRGGGYLAKMYSSKTFEKFIKNLQKKKFKKFSKIFQK